MRTFLFFLKISNQDHFEKNEVDDDDCALQEAGNGRCEDWYEEQQY
jgi:hypothetical protein